MKATQSTPHLAILASAIAAMVAVIPISIACAILAGRIQLRGRRAKRTQML